MNNIQLSSDSILNKKFDSTPRGYDPLEVDQFLDKIIQDYINIENNLTNGKALKELEKTIEELREQIKSLSLDNAKLKSRLANINDNDSVSADNIDLIKRINALEKFLYQHGYNPETIK